MSEGLTYTERLKSDYERIRSAVRSGSITFEQRMSEITDAVERYRDAHATEYDNAVYKAVSQGKAPGTVPIPFKDDAMLHKFADLVMYDDLTWSHPDKMSIVEFPILSDSQKNRRDGVETSLKWADSFDSTKTDRAPQTRDYKRTMRQNPRSRR